MACGLPKNRAKLESQVEGETGPDEATTLQAMQDILDTLPERYKPIDLAHNRDGYMLRINHGMVFKGKRVREVIQKTQAYVNEHEGPSGHFQRVL